MKNTIKSFLIVLAGLSLLPCAFAQQKAQPLELPQGEALNQIETIRAKVLEKDKLDNQYPPEFWSRREDPKNQSLRGIQIAGLAGELEYVSKAANLEEDSKVRRSWFKDVAGTLKEMSSVRFKMEEALENDNRTSYFKELNRYTKMRADLDELLDPKKRPVLSEEDLRKIKEERKRSNGKQTGQ